MTDKRPMTMTKGGISLSSTDDLKVFAEMVMRSGLAPAGLENINKLCVAIQTGLELGFMPMQALASIGVVNGRPVIYGEAGRALIHSHDLMHDVQEAWRLDDKRVQVEKYLASPPDGLTAVCMVKRKGVNSWFVGEFSVGRAKMAGIWGRANWPKYWPDMLMWKARWRADRQAFADVLRGVRYREEVEDYEPALVEARVVESVDSLEPIGPDGPATQDDPPDDDPSLQTDAEMEDEIRSYDEWQEADGPTEVPLDQIPF